MERRMLIFRIAMMLTVVPALCQNAWAQDYVAPSVTISKDKVKINGKVFYSHIVLERQTLYSISKAYNVSTDDIIKYNPGIKQNGLRKNDIINIPVVDIPQQPQPQPQPEPQPEPEVKSQPEVKPQSEPQQVQHQAAPNGAIKHTVKWYEDLSTIAGKYGVSEETIINANGLKDRKVRNRQVLIIPVQLQMYEELQEEQPAQAEESSEAEQSESDLAFIADFWQKFIKTTVDATLILPFKATGTTSSKNHMDFYSGVLLAAKEMQDNNIDLHLNVYDIAAGTSGIPAAKLKASDLIIGPIAPNDITQIYGIAGGNCPIISPLDQRAEKLTSKYRNVIQVPSSQYSQYVDLAKWIKEDSQADDVVIVITEKDLKQNELGKTMKAIMDKNHVLFRPFSYNILEGRDIQVTLEEKMTPVGVNRVIIASDNEAFVNDAVRNLNLIVHNKFQVVLYAPAKIRTFETIEVENFHNTSLHASLTFNIDYDDEKVHSFLRKYRAMFNTEPTPFAYQGYDVTKYFVSLVAKYKDGWMSHLENEDAQMLQSSFMFRNNGTGGYVNNGIRRIIYGKDYSIEEVL